MVLSCNILPILFFFSSDVLAAAGEMSTSKLVNTKGKIVWQNGRFIQNVEARGERQFAVQKEKL